MKLLTALKLSSTKKITTTKEKKYNKKQHNMASELESLAASLNEQFTQLDQTWIEATVINGRVRIGVAEASRKALEDKTRAAPAPSEQVARLTGLVNDTLASNRSTWATCGVDSELYFLSRGSQQLRTPDQPAGPSKPVLRYWACRGRVQALRLLLSDALGVDGWDNDVIPLSRFGEWKETLKADVEFAGAWHVLPVVRTRHTGPLVSQTEACARYLAAHLGVAGRDVDEQAAADAITCATYQAVTTNTFKALYAVDAASFETEYAALQSSYPVYLTNLVELLGQKEFFVDAARPLYADYFVLDALQHVELILGQAALRAHPTLLAFKSRMETRPNIAAEIARTHTNYCASPTEAENLERLAAKRQN